MSKYLKDGYAGWTGAEIAAARIVARKRLAKRLAKRKAVKQ